MERYGQILLIAMPAFLVLVLFEKWYGWYRGRDTYHHMDLISSLSSGITNVVKDVLGLSVSILSYGWLVDHLAIWKVETTWLVYFIAFMALDFSGYWVHRLAHEVNLFWNKHAIHHSSEDYNLACALRQSISSFVNLFTFFLIPAAIFGVPAEVIATVAPLHLFAQFWYHTRHIGKMGILEYIIVTPSHHRVHHSINPEYMDKNHSQIFIFWDKLFGTFQEELDHVPPVYGITRPAGTWNPVKINFQHLWLLTKDAWRANSWWDKIRIWWMPTGWRPADVEAQYPVAKIEDPYHFQRYAPSASPALKTWSYLQLIAMFAFTMYFFGNLGRIGSPGIFYYGAYVFLAVYAYSELMDRNANAVWWELLRAGFAIGIIGTNGDWFGLGAVWTAGPWVVAAFSLLSLAGAWYFRNEPVSMADQLA